MRSVQVFPNMELPQLTSLLDSFGERAGSEWFEAEHRLEVTLTRHESAQDLIQALEDEGSFSAPELDALRQVSDELAGAWVEVRVSGRGDYQAEMRDLVERLLAEGGYAFDDCSDNLWSLDQIRHGGSNGQRFRA
ncbi:hypothetical protein E0H73_32070 [Kribbella pittospori]|uniref:Uncharacterized protein n=1 Tax=Kribbella pittospori TaxID=722689 RepID=A0A4R0KDC6_9ACTN|nr:hypothetical protein [Kribbella pittospori]TCC57114.1 hypothetical protein E0H73_32070 [Kribbella pittospori]